MRTLERGFAVVEGPEGVISSAADVRMGMDVGIRFADGRAEAEIKNVNYF